jgi:hypothetical protein
VKRWNQMNFEIASSSASNVQLDESAS